MSYPEVDFLYLNEEDMVAAGVKDMAGCIEAMEEMFKLMKVGNYRMGGANGNSHGCMVMFPPSSPFPEMPVDGPDRRFMAMPAYLGGVFDMAGMKWYGSNCANKEKGLPRSILMLTLNERQPEFVYSGKRQQRCAVGPVFVCWRFPERGDLHYR